MKSTISIALLPTLLIQTMFVGSIAHSQNDIIYVSNPGAGTVSEINSVSGNETTFAAGLNNPEGLAVDSAGNVYVANSGDGTISQINSAGNVSTYASGFNSPISVACDPYGNVYVATPNNGTISQINSSKNVSVFASGLTFNPDGSNVGTLLASDNVGNIYAGIFQTIAGYPQQTVTSFDSHGNQTIVANAGDNYMEGFAVDGAGHLYYGLANADSVDGNGSLQTTPFDYPPPYNSDPDTSLFSAEPVELAFDTNGNLYVTFSELFSNENGTENNVSDALVEFGANGVNTLIATDIGGYDIAVETVPEPGILTLASGLAAVLFIRRWSSRRRVYQSTPVLIPIHHVSSYLSQRRLAASDPPSRLPQSID